MKRFWIVLLVMAVAIVIALPVSAAVDCDNDDKFANHPQCQGVPDPPPDEPLVGLTCAKAAIEYGIDHVPVTWDTWGEDNDKVKFTVVVGPRDDACVDVLSDEGIWIVEIELVTALEITMGVQDSVAPGDACWGGCAGGGVITESGTYQFETPASATNACDFDFADPDFDDDDPALTFSASASYRGNPHIDDANKATITVKLP